MKDCIELESKYKGEVESRLKEESTWKQPRWNNTVISLLGDACQNLEKKKMQVTMSLNEKKKKLEDLLSVHQETTVFIEAELEARSVMLQRVKDKVINDKKELAKLDMKKQASAEKAAEELFAMAEMLEKDLNDKGKKEELTKIRDHRKKLQDLDRQLRLAERREKFGSKDGEDEKCVILWVSCSFFIISIWIS